MQPNPRSDVDTAERDRERRIHCELAQTIREARLAVAIQRRAEQARSAIACAMRQLEAQFPTALIHVTLTFPDDEDLDDVEGGAQ